MTLRQFAIAVILLTMTSCYPVSLGDAKDAKLNPALIGFWYATEPDKRNEKNTTMMIAPCSETSYVIQIGGIAKDGSSEVAGVVTAWITDVEGTLFLNAQFLPDIAAGRKPQYFFAKMSLVEDILVLRVVNPADKGLESITERTKMRAAIAARKNDDKLYGSTLTLRRVGSTGGDEKLRNRISAGNSKP